MENFIKKVKLSLSILFIIHAVFIFTMYLNRIVNGIPVFNIKLLPLSIIIILVDLVITFFILSFISGFRFNLLKITFFSYLPLFLIYFNNQFSALFKSPFKNEFGYFKYLMGLTLLLFIMIKIIFVIFPLFSNLKISIHRKVTIFLIIFSYSLILIVPWSYIQGLQGDEIEYISNLYSISKDFDLNLANNLKVIPSISGTIPRVLPPLVIRNKLGKFIMFSQHSNLLLFHLIMLPFFYLGGRFLLLFLFSIIAIFTIRCISLNLYFLQDKPGQSDNTGFNSKNILIFTIFTALNPFIIIYSAHIYQELIAGLILLILLYYKQKNVTESNYTNLLFITMMIFPWFNLRYLVFSIVIWIYSFITIRKSRLKFTLFLALNIFLYLSVNKIIYGDFSFTANTGMPETRYMDFNFLKTFLALFFDQEFGLLIYSPVFILALPGFIVSIKDKKFILTNLMFTSYLVMIIFYGGNWYGGHSPPFRLLVPVLCILSVYIYITLINIKNFFVELIYFILNSYGVCISFILLLVPFLRYNPRYDGRNQIFSLFLRKKTVLIFPVFAKRYFSNHTYITVSFYLIPVILFYCYYFYILRKQKNEI